MKSICLSALGRKACRTGLTAILTAMGWSGFAASDVGTTFAAPEAAVSALAKALQTTNRLVLREIFGSRASELVSPDSVQAAGELAAFAAALGETNHLARESDTKCVLEVGAQAYPFPVPLIQQDGRWSFDTPAGCEEMRVRRIGRNELATLQTVRAYVQGQREYASRDRDGSGVLKYAQKILSSPGRKDGLYWTPDLDGEISPLGPLAASAQREGYGSKLSRTDGAPEPYHGYFLRILTRQGRHAAGNKYSYIINGNMIGGFALVAWPAQYGESGVMTFVVNQQGRVYQKDLGQKTASLAAKMKEYDPDSTWQLSRD